MKLLVVHVYVCEHDHMYTINYKGIDNDTSTCTIMVIGAKVKCKKLLQEDNKTSRN